SFPDTVAGALRMTERILLTAELSVFITWTVLAMLTTWAVRRGSSNALEAFLAEQVRDPRRVFYLGLVAHIAVFVLRYALRGTEWAASIKPALFLAAPSVLALLIAACGLLAASKVPKEGFKLRVIGLLHTMADGIKMIWKEDFMPKRGDRLLHSIGPMLGMFPPLVVMAVVPFGDVLCFAKNAEGGIQWTQILPVVSRDGVCAEAGIPMQIANLDIGILFIFAVSGIGILGAAIGGWASDNKYSLLGALRAAGQLVSYEITLGMTLIGLLMIYSTFRLDDMVRWQGNNAWGVFVQPLAFFLFFIAATAETKRIPFDLPEGESEILGYFTEYSSMKFGMYFFSEYIEVVTSSAVMITLFFGGWNLPFLHRDGLTIAIGDAVLLKHAMTHGSVVALQVVAFFLKVAAFAWLQVVVRWTLPRFRYDQLMKMCWRMLLPLSIANVFVTAILLLIIDNASLMAKNALGVAADLTQLTTMIAFVVAIVAMARWLLAPAKKHRVVLTSTAKMVAEQGGTRHSPMQA
ncbi:MAG TPA: NADH-quinone oxidoreductase subunit H, partial [Polyangiaceae bacterium]|nr:NADH-quinone oxidoreductase subunit H [Polyangiaceae bacterium]